MIEVVSIMVQIYSAGIKTQGCVGLRLYFKSLRRKTQNLTC